MKVATVQFQPVLNELDANITKIATLIDEVMLKQADTDLILFPELATSGYECGKSFYDIAEVFIDGDVSKLIGKYASKYNVNIVYGFPEEDPTIKGVLYNSAGIIDRKGMPVGTYRKVHLFAGEKYYFRPGDSYPVFHLDCGRIGIFICWDTLYPEVARCLALGGAELLLIPTNWESPYDREWDFMTSARAFDNTLHLVASNRIGTDKTLSFFGHSRILNPLGDVIQSLDEAVEGILYADIDLEETRRLRSGYWTQMTERRSDTFGALSQRYPDS